MAQRTLDSSFWDDTDVAKLSLGERLLLICMFTDVSLSDDFGNLPANPKLLKKHAFGYDDDVTTEQVSQWRNGIISKCHNIQLYVVNEQEYISLVKFSQWQHLHFHRKSNIPKPPDQAEYEEPIEDVDDSDNPDTETVSDEDNPEAESVANNCRTLVNNCGTLVNNLGKFPLSRVEKSSVEKGSVGEGSVGSAQPDERGAPTYPYLLDMFTRMSGIKKMTKSIGVSFDWLYGEYGGEKLEYAIREAGIHGAVNLPYISAILEGKKKISKTTADKNQGGSEVMMAWGN